MKTIKGLWISCALAAIGCGKKAEPPSPTAAEPPKAAAPASPEQPPPAVREAPKAVILSVQPQWIISDSRPMMQVTLFGQDLARHARVESSSPQIVIEKVEPDPGRTVVLATVAANTPSGDYELRYIAPGQDPIPFKIHYQARR